MFENHWKLPWDALMESHNLIWANSPLLCPSGLSNGLPPSQHRPHCPVVAGFLNQPHISRGQKVHAWSTFPPPAPGIS